MIRDRDTPFSITSKYKLPFKNTTQVKSYESHADHLKERVSSLERKLEESAEEKQRIMSNLKRREAEEDKLAASLNSAATAWCSTVAV